MAAVTDRATREPEARQVTFNHSAGLVAALLAAAALVATARTSAVALLVAVAVLQAVIGVVWLLGTGVVGRNGGLIVVAMAAGGADLTVSLWPHGRLGTLLIVFGLSVPVLFVHQVLRGAARVRLLESLGGIAVAIVAVVGLAALLQLRHEWVSPTIGGKVVAGVVAAAAGGLVVGYLVDLITPRPHFDQHVPRGLLGLIGSAGAGGSIGHLLLRSNAEFVNGRGAFVGASVGALVGLLAVAVAFVEFSAPMPDGAFSRRLRPLLGGLVPFGLLAPVAYLLCLAVRA